MDDNNGPWGSLGPAPQPPPKPARSRPWLWLACCAGLVAIIAALAHAFPEAVRTRDQWAQVAYLGGVLLVLASGLSRVRRGNIGQYLRYGAVWLGVVGVLALGLAYRDELTGVVQHLRVAFSAGTPVAVGEREMVVPQDENGGFMLVGKVNGQRVRFMVDTGASETVLSPDDARRLGIDINGLRYDDPAETANGLGYGARYIVPRLEVGSVVVDDFPVTINQAPMSSSLLGMSFLRKLESFEVRGHQLILRAR
jgi:aspartyl protease family protein